MSLCPWITGAHSASEASVQHLWACNAARRPACYQTSAVWPLCSLSSRSARFMRKPLLCFSHLPLVPLYPCTLASSTLKVLLSWSEADLLLYAPDLDAVVPTSTKHCQSHARTAIGQQSNTQPVYYPLPQPSNQTPSSYLKVWL